MHLTLRHHGQSIRHHEHCSEYIQPNFIKRGPRAQLVASAPPVVVEKNSVAGPLATSRALVSSLGSKMTVAPELLSSGMSEQQAGTVGPQQLPAAAGLSSDMSAPVAVQKSFLDIQADAALPAIGGHRGMGANVIRGGALAPAWRENTLRSFQAAAASGATFVEFDVQVTADGVPVIWHDDHVEYGDPTDPNQCKVADLTAAEFQALGALSASGKCQQLSVVRRFKHAAAAKAAMEPQEAVATVVAGSEPSTPQRRRWCCEVDDAFPTLEQLFSSLPGHLAFNIEVKMATPHDLAATPAEEIQRMVGPILDVVQRSTAGSSDPAQQQRQVVFSSFDPDVCRALREAQQQHQVMFLTTGGRDWHADPRRMSLAAAVEEAASSKLSGVVMDSGALHAYPEVVAQARKANLKLLTYGLENDSVSWVLQQQQLGVTGVIVDNLEGLMAALRNGSASPPPMVAVMGAGESALAGAAAAAAVEELVGQVAVQALEAQAPSAASASLMSMPSAQQPLRPAVVAT